MRSPAAPRALDATSVAAAPRVPRTSVSSTGGTVGVVVTTYNHAHFLDDALSSLAVQVVRLTQ